LVALFWLPAFLAWQAGDRTTSGAILLGAFILGAVPLWFGRRHLEHADDAKSGGWYVAICGLLFLGLLNWRLDVWLAALRGVELDAMHRALPMALIHGMSGVAVAWTAALVFITQPDPKR
jgi:multisubunit Na+/H+ antiporter MnhE subunit